MNVKGTRIRVVGASSDVWELKLAVKSLVKFGGAVEGDPIQSSDLMDGEGPHSRPSLQRIQKTLEEADIILVKLSAVNFLALRLCEIRHSLQLPASIVVQSASSYFHQYKATPFFQGFMDLGVGGMDQSVQKVAKQIARFSSKFLDAQKTYSTIEHYLEHASCFRWGTASMRHAAPNRFSLEQYRSGVGQVEMQRIYREYMNAKHEARPMHLVMGDQYNFTHANSVGPHNEYNNSRTNSEKLENLADELTQLVECLRASKADFKSEPICVVAAAAEAAASGRQSETMAHLSSISGGVLEPEGKKHTARDWILDNASKIGLDLATAAIKTAFGI